MSEILPSLEAELGNTLRSQGRFADAIAAYKRALAVEPTLLAAHYGLGLSHLATQQYNQAASCLRSVVKAEPDNGLAHLNLAIALSRCGHSSDAIAHHRHAIEILKAYAPAHFALGLTLRAQSDLMAAHHCFAEAVKIDPKWPQALLELGRSFIALDHLDESIPVLRRALTLNPRLPEAHLVLGDVLRVTQHLDEAADCYRQANDLAPNTEEPLIGLGFVRLAQFHFAEARVLFDKVLTRNPAAAAAIFGIALSYRDEGDFLSAAEWFEKTLALCPDHQEAYRSLAMIKKAEPGDQRIERMEKTLATVPMAERAQANLHFALGKLYDDICSYDSAFQHYALGNAQLKSVSRPFKPQDFTDHVDRIMATFTPELLRSKAGMGSASECPVFIVGMTRSGTTLVEQIAASHSRVHGHGELDYMRQIERSLPQRLGTTDGFPECVRLLDAGQAKAIATDYERALIKVAPQALRNINKMPGNFRYLGLIALCFPNARIIHCVRDPRDTCLSSYFLGNYQAAFERDLTWLGSYYRDYRRLMNYWQASLPNPILEIPYEGLVTDQANWTRKLLSFLDLVTEDSCFTFYRTKRGLRSASAWQVRQPIYASSIGRWRHYEKHLLPLFSALQGE